MLSHNLLLKLVIDKTRASLVIGSNIDYARALERRRLKKKYERRRIKKILKLTFFLKKLFINLVWKEHEKLRWKSYQLQ